MASRERSAQASRRPSSAGRKLPPFAATIAEMRYACLDMLPRAVSGLAVSCAGVERCMPGYRVDRAGYGCLGLEFVAEGEGTLVLNNAPYLLKPGCYFTYGPGIPHLILSNEKRPLLKYFVNFFGREGAPLLERAGIAMPGLGSVVNVEGIRKVFEELLREAGSAGAARAEIASAYVRIMLMKCGERQADGKRSSSRAFSTLQRALDLIEKRYATLNSLARLASAANVDPAHLCRLFMRFRGDTPQRYLTRQKLNVAARLLTQESTLVKEVAAAVGYEDAMHFSRLFRRTFGCSPSEFQRQQTTAFPETRKD